MWGAIASAAIQLGTSIAGGVMSAKAARKRKNYLKKEKVENENWYNRRYNEDATQRADAQQLLRRTRETIMRNNQAAAGTQAVTGGTDESVAAVKEQNAKALADAAGQISASAEARKENIDTQYNNNKRSINAQLAGVEAERAQNIANTTSNAVNAIGQAGSAISSSMSSKSAGTSSSTTGGSMSTKSAGTTLEEPSSTSTPQIKLGKSKFQDASANPYINVAMNDQNGQQYYVNPKNYVL
jgi:hypothetical protein